ncbi:squamous cell carcinoma antigen-like [Mucor ambiguus]|uniref:Squamous cell carcinoma antigen-like n=1 Tax=Mucor ambiguus TaxID=91626 RepID=A0A0C9MHE4_9FUNG|nr:squamous cell carcinoma antigen-like [Mucor ambiguus]
MDAVEEKQVDANMEMPEETTAVEQTMEENAPSEATLTAEEQESQKTMQAYDALLDIKEKLMEDSTQYELHVKYIELLKQLDLQDQLEEARVAMHDIYPLTETLWLDWINDAKKDTSVEGQIKLLSLYNHAEQDYLSIKIWKDYVDYILDKFHQGFSQDIVDQDDSVSEFIDQTRQDLLKAVRATSAHVKSSQDIWKPYSEFELEILERFKDADQLNLVRKMYLDRLATLHIDCEDTFSAYSTFVSNYDNSNYEDTMVKANKIYTKTKKAAEERDQYEMQLSSSGYSLDAFHQYIEHEKRTKNMHSLVYVRSIYERAIVYYCTDPALWDDYILFLIEQAKVQVFLETTCLRAIRNCPWSGTLWAHLARLMEFGNKEDDQIDDIFDRALSSKPLLSSVEDLVTVLLAKCDFKRRRIDWEDPDDDDVMDLRVAFEESLQYIAEALPDSGDPYYRIEKYYAYISAKRLGDMSKAKEIWQHVVEHHGLNTEAWIDYIMFERDQGHYEKCESLFKQAIQKNIDNPVRLISVWTSMEHEIGTLASFETSLVKINQKSKILARQWQAQSQKQTQHQPQPKQMQELTEEQKASHAKEKKEMDRKKKSAHRLAQKQRAKEKKKEHAAPNEVAIEQPADVKVETPTEASTVNEQAHPAADQDVTAPTSAEPENAEQDVSSRKRKLSIDGKEDDESAKKHKSNETEPFKRPIAPFKAKPRSVRPNTRRGKSVKLPQKTLNRNDVQTIKEANTKEDTQDVPEKTNDDFRAMLLSSKK